MLKITVQKDFTNSFQAFYDPAEPTLLTMLGSNSQAANAKQIVAIGGGMKSMMQNFSSLFLYSECM